MKNIKVTNKMYNSLVELSEEINNQNHRHTQMPYFFQIRTKEKIATPEYVGIDCWHMDGRELETDEEIKECIFEIKEWDIENESDILSYNMLADFEIDEILEGYGWRKVWYDYEDTYKNSFLTEKACKEHIRMNNYHYNEPIDYLSYAFRNPEMELIFKFLCELTGGKLHK